MTSLLLLFILVAFIPGGSLAVDYTVTNTAPGTPGGAKFDTDIGADYTGQTMSEATSFIWAVFEQINNPSDRKDVPRVDLFVNDMDGVAFASNNQINVSARYINGYGGDVRREITGVVYHEMTHIWQWNGAGQTPGGLIEGIADYVRLKGGYAPSHWVGAGQGNRWDQGYDVTARFLEYCNDDVGGSFSFPFVAELNKRMRNGYSVSLFEQILGKPVDTLWRDYKAKYYNTTTTTT